jgi:hypothetical protein
MRHVRKASAIVAAVAALTLSSCNRPAESAADANAATTDASAAAANPTPTLPSDAAANAATGERKQPPPPTNDPLLDQNATQDDTPK